MKTLNVELSLSKPTDAIQTGLVKGMTEFFDPKHFQQGPMVVMICSPWVDDDPLRRLVELLRSAPGRRHRVYLLTMLAHSPSYWNQAMAPVLRTLAGELGCNVEVRVLPIPYPKHNVMGLSAEALHAKIYLLAGRALPERPDSEAVMEDLRRYSEDVVKGLKEEHLREAFFGSANFTGNGQHCGDRASNHKWELVARATDPAGRIVVRDEFYDLWDSAYRLGKDHRHFFKDWCWPDFKKKPTR